ncbi:patatin-like phospholipase domain-containing protein 7 [Octopus vulgaris]|uniref:lysophospholipase n=1 Tax=Octopus vulgaris TaxID=6645 RepID=A0AA36AG48_OCTVU|nr:patatin-like phospholipase domain-containing protein 7 [Octopus vulgaris]
MGVTPSDLITLNSFNWLRLQQVIYFSLFWIIVFGLFAVFVFIIIWGFSKLKAKVLPNETQKSKIRFRKRDKVLFYGRKMLRKVKTFTKNNVLGPRGRMKKRQLVLKLARRLLEHKKENHPKLLVKEPPRSFLEVDSSEQDESDHRLPSDILYMLRSVRVFGHLQKDLFLELCRDFERKFIPANSYLFRIGDNDDSIYVVESGKIHVCFTESDGMDYLVKEVQTGESIHSLLSIVDVLTGHPSPFKTVSAKAVENTHVLRLPVQAFQSVFETYPDSLVRVVQIIMVRLQRVTFLALHKYLGLCTELINPLVSQDENVKNLNIYSLLNNSHGSPQRSISLKDHQSTPLLNLPCQDVTSSLESETIDYSSEKSSGYAPKENYLQRSTSMCSSVSATSDSISVEFDPIFGRSQTSFQRNVAGGLAPVQLSDDELARQRMNIKRHASLPMGYSLSAGRTLMDVKKLELIQVDLSNLFKLKDPSLLDDKMTLKQFKAGTILQKQGDQDCNLFFVVSGTLNVSQNLVGHEEKETLLFSAGLGRLVGALAVLTGEPSMFTVRSKTESEVVLISKADFYSIMKKQPSIVLQAAHTIVKRMSAFVRQIDFALDWTMLEAGKALFRQDDPCNSIYIILTGRLRSIITTPNDKKELVGEYGRGDLVGIVEALTQTQRATTLMAVRDTELADIPAELLNHIKRKYPQIVARLIHLLGQRLLGSLQSRSAPLSIENRLLVSNLSTVAVVPVSRDVPLTNFVLELQHALNAIGPTARITSEIVSARIGSSGFNSLNDFRLFSWLGQHEDINRMVLYQCDNTMTRWTKHFVRQADCILIVGVATNDPTSLGEVETQLENIAVRAQKELILLHKEGTDTPRRTADWLNARGWCSSHHHIRCPKRVFSKKNKEKTLETYKKLFESEPDRMSDFARLARFLTGTSIGLVLGGGGARGISHMGMIRAMAESGIPIDIVGGTSIGSIMGAIWAESQDVTRSVQRAREWSNEMTSLWKKVLDLTYPVTSMFTGCAFNKSLENVFKDRQIEDLWIPYFCVTTDICSSSMRVHTTGSLWRYVRASMSLSGYLPPLCDPIDGHLLLDGGYVNNLPADVMRAKGAQTIFAVDVGSQTEDELTNYGDELSGWWLLWNRWNPWAKNVKVPDMNEIQSRLAYVSCVRQLEMVKNSDYCEYVRPPIDKFKTLQFGSFDEIYEVGYHHAKTLFSGWIKGGILEDLFKEKSEERKFKKKASPLFPSMPTVANFTDLAELVSKIEDHAVNYSSESEEEVIHEEEFDDRHNSPGSTSSEAEPLPEEELVTKPNNPVRQRTSHTKKKSSA